MKIYICTNKFQKLAAKVATYSFSQLGYNDIEILELEKNEFLKSKINLTYLRNGKLTKFVDDLQSFTLLRFLPFTLDNNKKCLIIDPDVFALQDPKNKIDKIFDEENFQIACTKIDDKFRSEVMFLKNINIDWSFEDIVNDLFNHKIDYKELINLTSKKYFSNIFTLPISFNHHDNIYNDTLFLHTSKRITQPWKEGLRIDFQKEDLSKFYKFKQILKKILNMKYDMTGISNFYIEHPNKNVSERILYLFKKSLISGSINKLELRNALENKYVSKIFIEKIEK